MRKIYILIIVVLFSLLFGCTSHKDTEKGSNYDKTSDNLISVPSILSDNNISLEPSSLNGVEMCNIINMISQNTLTGVGGSYSLQDVNAISPIKQLRKCSNTDEVYNVYEIGKGRFYVFYGDYRSMPNQVVFYCYSEKILLFLDFDNIKIGKSTIDDVKRIDETTEYLDNGFFTPQKVVNDETVVYDDYSIHMTKEGVVSIGYKNIDGKLYVDYINKKNEKRISGINTLDLPEERT